MRDAARAIAFGRIAFGLGALVAPRLATGLWVGPEAGAPGTTVLARALGARDVLLGFMALHTLDRADVAARWQRSLAACDAVDGLSTLAAGRSRGVAAFALGTAVVEAALAQQLSSAADSAAAQPT
jgi:hypothetical protein